jgi:hypothetical protein
MLGMKLGKTRQQAAKDHRVGEDHEVWAYIEKYEATQDLNPAVEFAEREISDPAIKEFFLDIAPKLTRGSDIFHAVEGKYLPSNHPIWPLLEKYLKELLAKL